MNAKENKQPAIRDTRNSVSKLVDLINKNQSKINPTNKYITKDSSGKPVELSRHSFARKSDDGRATRG